MDREFFDRRRTERRLLLKQMASVAVFALAAAGSFTTIIDLTQAYEQSNIDALQPMLLSLKEVKMDKY